MKQRKQFVGKPPVHGLMQDYEKRVSAMERAGFVPEQKTIYVHAPARRIPPQNFKTKHPRPRIPTNPSGSNGLYAIDFDTNYWTYSGDPDGVWVNRGDIPNGTKPILALNGSYYMTNTGFTIATYPTSPTETIDAPAGIGTFIADVIGDETETRQVVLTQNGADVYAYLYDDGVWTLLYTIADADGLGIVHFKTLDDNIVGISYVKDDILYYDFSRDAAPDMGITWSTMIVDNTGIVLPKPGYKLWYDQSQAKTLTAYTVDIPPVGVSYNVEQHGTLNFTTGSKTIDVNLFGKGIVVLQIIMASPQTISSVTDPNHTWTLLGTETVPDGSVYLYTSPYDTAVDPTTCTITIDGTGNANRTNAWVVDKVSSILSWDMFVGDSPLVGTQSGGTDPDFTVSMWDNAQWNQATGTLITAPGLERTTPHFPGEQIGAWAHAVSEGVETSWVWEWTNNTKEIIIPVFMFEADLEDGTRFVRVGRADGNAVGEGDQWENDIINDLYPDSIVHYLKDFVHDGDVAIGYIAGLSEPFFLSLDGGSSWQKLASPESVEEDIAGIQIGTAITTGAFVLFSNGNTYYLDLATLIFTFLVAFDPDISADTPLLFGITRAVVDE